MTSLIVVYFSLVLARVATFVAVLPLLGGRDMPRTVKAGLAVVLSILWGSAFWDRMAISEWMLQTGVVPWLGFGIALGREALLGGLIGYLFGLFLMPARIAGDFLAQEMGLSFGNMVGITGEINATALSTIFEMLAALTFFSLDGHHVFLGVMHGTFEHYPVGGGLPTLAVPQLVAGATAVEEWGLMLAAPVAFCLFLTTIVLTLLARATPQLNLYTVGFPLRLGVGLIALLLLLPGIVASFVGVFSRCGQLLAGIL
ncbi:MAG: flagellar biosynthetic protein FliR [Planctomycetes bacterium]|nr:flagellar biosynthetic protein FliR [Planctomycetota bacterium]